MSTFSLWWNGFRKKPQVRPVTWLCGTEVVLIDEIITTIKKILAPDPWNYASFTVGEESEREIWAEASQLPTGQGNHLVVVRNAEKLKQKNRLAAFAKQSSENPKTFLVLISNEEKIPKTEPSLEERRKGIKGDKIPYLAVLGTKAHTVECLPFTQSTAKHAVAWVKSKVSMRDGIAGHLLDRANGDLRLVRDVCRKLSVFPGEITLTTINEMLSERPRDSFMDALLALDKKTALLALQDLSVGEYSRVLGLLDSRLDIAGTVHSLLISHKTPSEIARALGNQSFLAPDLIPVAKSYDLKRRTRIRQTLSVADEHLRDGNRQGVLEMVTLFW